MPFVTLSNRISIGNYWGQFWKPHEMSPQLEKSLKCQHWFEKISYTLQCSTKLQQRIVFEFSQTITTLNVVNDSFSVANILNAKNH